MLFEAQLYPNIFGLVKIFSSYRVALGIAHLFLIPHPTATDNDKFNGKNDSFDFKKLAMPTMSTAKPNETLHGP
jgi:hypothetical protein